MSAISKLAKSVKKPRFWLIGGAIIVGAIILFSLMRGSSSQSASASGPSEALQNARLQAETQLALQQSNIQGQVAIASMQANAQMRELEATLKALELQGAVDMSIANMQQQLLLEQLAADREINMRMISSQEAMLFANLEASVARDQIAANAMIAQQEMLAQISMSQIAANVAIAQANNAASVQLAQTQAGAQKSSNKYGFLGGLVGGVLSLFSDVRAKQDIEWVGISDSGNNIYSYSYAGDNARVSGVMAQELLSSNPGAVTPVGNLLAVDYARV